MRASLRTDSWRAAASAVLALAVALPAGASDHADPVQLAHLESGLTGLFFFPDGDDMILVLGTRRALLEAGPYDLEPFEFAVHMDLHSRVAYDRPADLARYGGTVVDPSGIKPDVTIKIRLEDDATLGEKSFEGLANPEAIRVYTGVRDDPFIFPRFFKRNIVAMVLAIPKSSFPEGQQDWLLWGTSSQDGEQIDHVGRSNRTQLGRFDFLNTVPPAEQVARIQAELDRTTKIAAFLARLGPLKALGDLYKAVLALRFYDVAPDVMIYSERFPPGFPNGRLLTDDVVGLTCHAGECLLLETAFTESPAWPRETTNDKPFLAAFPYLAEPWPEMPEPKPPSSLFLPLVLGVLVILVLIQWLLCRWCSRRARRRAA